MDETLAAILENTYSLTQLNHRLRVLKSNLLKTFFGQSTENSLSQEDLKWLQSLPPDFYKQFNKDNVYQLFTSLDEAKSKLQTLILYLTFEPDEETTVQIGSFVRKTFSTFLLLDIKLDPHLIAGAALSFNGIHKDYSMKVRIEERKAEILQGFRRFLR